MSIDPSPSELVGAEEIRHLAQTALSRAGYSPDEVAVTVDHLVDAALCGYSEALGRVITLHGQPTLAGRRPTVVAQSEVTVSIDGDGGLGYVAMMHLTRLLIEKAELHGVAAGVAGNCSGTGRSSYYVERVARKRMVGMHAAGGGGGSLVAPPGARAGLLGTNPIAFGFPLADGPFVFDMSTAAVTVADVTHRSRLGGTLPEGVALDVHGEPTCDPTAALAGSLLTFGSHKGFGLSLCIQLLGLLASPQYLASCGEQPGSLMVVIDPSRFLSVTDYEVAASELIRRLKVLPRQASDPLRIPSERSFSLRRQHLETGLPVDARLMAQLRHLAAG